MKGVKLYCVDGKYHQRMRDAVRAAKATAKTSAHDIEVTLVFIATDKANILRMLNLAGGHTETLELIFTAKAGNK